MRAESAQKIVRTTYRARPEIAQNERRTHGGKEGKLNAENVQNVQENVATCRTRAEHAEYVQKTCRKRAERVGETYRTHAETCRQSTEHALGQSRESQTCAGNVQKRLRNVQTKAERVAETCRKYIENVAGTC